jgi:hypothetical protein
MIWGGEHNQSYRIQANTDDIGNTAAAQAVIMACLCVGLAIKSKAALTMMVVMYYLFDDAFAFG